MLTRERAEVWTKFGINVDFKKMFDSYFFFLFYRKGEKNYPQSWGCETYFVKYLENYCRHNFCTKIDNDLINTINTIFYKLTTSQYSNE